MNIDYLADYPEYIQTIAPWVLDHWGDLLQGETLVDRIAKLKKHCNKTDLPLALVAHENGKAYGTAALRIHDLDDRTELTPWLGGVFVGLPYRRQGIGESLCQAIENTAFNLVGETELYLFTLDQKHWYQKMGWEELEPCVWSGLDGFIMHKLVSS